MIEAKDILLNDNFEILIENGDFKVDSSDQQHVQCILLARNGQFYNNVLIGCGVQDYQNGTQSIQEKKQNIILNLESDNYIVNELIIKTDNFSSCPIATN